MHGRARVLEEGGCLLPASSRAFGLRPFARFVGCQLLQRRRRRRRRPRLRERRASAITTRFTIGARTPRVLKVFDWCASATGVRARLAHERDDRAIFFPRRRRSKSAPLIFLIARPKSARQSADKQITITECKFMHVSANHKRKLSVWRRDEAKSSDRGENPKCANFRQSLLCVCKAENTRIFEDRRSSQDCSKNQGAQILLISGIFLHLDDQLTANFAALLLLDGGGFRAARKLLLRHL